jgi:hypothetical protein
MRASGILALARGLGGLPRLALCILLWGQSNGAGVIPGAQGQSEIGRLLGPDLLACNEAGSFVQMGEGAANFKGDNSGPCGGQSLTRVMRRIADVRGQTVRCWAHCYTGQGIDYFMPDSATRAHYADGSQHASKNNFTLLTDAVTASGLEPDLMIHWQGEANVTGYTQAEYYARLRIIWDARHAQYPSAHLIIVGTLTGGPSNEIAAAQRQLADEEPMVHYVDLSDLYGNTAYWGGAAGEHFTDFLGYEVAADRIWATLQRASRAPVPAVDHIDDLSSVYTHHYRYRRSITGSELGIWQPQAGTDSLIDIAGKDVPAHVPSDSTFANRSSARFRSGFSETLSVACASPSLTGINWTWFGTVKIGNVGADMCLFSVRDPDGSNHNWAARVKAGGVLVLEYGGADMGAGVQLDLVEPMTIGVVVDGTNTQARLYVNGVLVSTVTLTGTQQNPTAPRVWLGSRFGTAQFFDGWIHATAFGNGAGTTPQMLASHQWGAAEALLEAA